MTTETETQVPGATEETPAGTSTTAAEAAGIDTSAAGTAKADAPAADGKEGGDKPQGGKPEPKSSFEAVQEVYKASRTAAEKAAGKGVDGGAPAPQQESQAAQAAEGAEASKPAPGVDPLKDRIPDEEFRRLTPRSQRLVSKLRDSYRDLDTKFKQAAPVVQAQARLTAYMQSNGLTPQMANDALGLYAAVMQDPVRAKQALDPLIEYVNRQLGEVLPEDIAGRVNSGEISEQAGKELARARAAEARTGAREQARTQAAREAQAEAQRRGELTERTQKVTQAVTTWESAWKGSDPDYSKKARFVIPHVTRVLEAKAAAGQIPTEAEALKLVKDIRKQVEDQMAELAPRPKPSSVVTGGTSTQAAPPPKSSAEAVKRAYLERRNAA